MRITNKSLENFAGSRIFFVMEPLEINSPVFYGSKSKDGGAARQARFAKSDGILRSQPFGLGLKSFLEQGGSLMRLNFLFEQDAVVVA